MSTFALQTTYTDETRGYGIGDDVTKLEDMYDDVLNEDGSPNMGEIYRVVVKLGDVGVCRSSVYVDTASGTKRVGWYFEKRDKYEDTNGSYLRGAWVTVGEYAPRQDEHVTYGSVSA